MEVVLVLLDVGRHKHMKVALECQQFFGGKKKSKQDAPTRYTHTCIAYMIQFCASVSAVNNSYYVHSLQVLAIYYQLYLILLEQVYHRIGKLMVLILLTLSTMDKM